MGVLDSPDPIFEEHTDTPNRLTAIPDARKIGAREFNNLRTFANEVKALVMDAAKGNTALDTRVDRIEGLTWDDASYPVMLAHRGTDNVSAPENTFAAFDYAAALNAPLEGDVQMTADGGLVFMHDTTTTRTTGVAATTRQLTLHSMLGLDASYIHPGPSNIFVPQRIPTFAEWLRRYGRSSLLLPEVKDETVETAQAMATLVKNMGLSGNVAIQCFSDDPLVAVKAVDPAIKTVRVYTTQIPVSLAVQYGHWAVFVRHDYIDQAYVNDMHAAGVKVFAWTLTNYQDTARLMALGVDGITFNDPAYGKLIMYGTPAGSHAISAPPSWLAGAGWLAGGTTGAVPAVASGFATFEAFAGLADGNLFRIQVPFRTLDSLPTQTITATLKAVQVTTTDTRWFGLRFAWTTDGDVEWYGSTNTRGYHFAYRRTGAVAISRVVAGSGSDIATASGWPTLAQGDVVKVRIDVTATSITATLLELNGVAQSGKVITVSDSANPRGGLVMAVGSGIVPGVSSVSLTH